jgi:hypothetical protein
MEHESSTMEDGDGPGSKVLATSVNDGERAVSVVTYDYDRKEVPVTEKDTARLLADGESSS